MPGLDLGGFLLGMREHLQYTCRTSVDHQKKTTVTVVKTGGVQDGGHTKLGETKHIERSFRHPWGLHYSVPCGRVFFYVLYENGYRVSSANKLYG